MALKIVRNDITRMQCEAIVNTANPFPIVGPGCDYAIYSAAGYEKLLAEREKIGCMEPGEVAITPGFDLPAKYIIHAVSPAFIDGNSGEEEKLRNCYKNSLHIALENNIKSIAFPLISTGSFGYPKEEGLRIALDEINDFLMNHEMDVTIVVFGNRATKLASRIDEDIEELIDEDYVTDQTTVEYSGLPVGIFAGIAGRHKKIEFDGSDEGDDDFDDDITYAEAPCPANATSKAAFEDIDYNRLESALKERASHLTDTFSEYLLYLIDQNGLTNVGVYTKAVIDKKVFSKLKNNKDYHPSKIVALQLCIGAELNIDQTKDLLARAGYALSPCDLTDMVFGYFIENKIYDVIEIDIQLENLGVECIIK